MKNIGSLVIYLSAYSMSIGISLIYQKYGYQKKGNRLTKFAFMLLIILPVVIMQGSRYLVGTDYRSYAIIFDRVAAGNVYELESYASEPLYLLEIRILSALFGHYIWFFVVNAVVESMLMFSLFDFFQNTISMPLAYMAYYSIVQPFFMNAERQGVAMTIVWFSMKYFVRKDFIKFFLCIIVAGCMHNTAFFFVLLYALHLVRRLKTAGIWEFIAVSLLLVFSISPDTVMAYAADIVSVFPQYTVYFGGYKGEISMAWVLPVLFVIPCLFNVRSTAVRNSSYNTVWLYLYLVNISLVLLSGTVNQAFRFALYFNIAVILLIPMTLVSMKLEGNKRIFLCGYVFLFLSYYIILYYVVESSQVYPYRSIWTERVMQWN